LQPECRYGPDGEVSRIADEMKDHYIDPFRVKIIGSTNPIAKAVMEIYRQYPGRVPPRFDGSAFGGIGAAELYIYPPLARKP
jgi:hypothetical protein